MSWTLRQPRLWIPAAALLAFGLVNVYSASMPLAAQHYGDPNYFVARQAVWAILATGVFLAALRIPLGLWARIAPMAVLLSLALLMLMEFTPLGVQRNGAVRWIAIGPFTVQPTEFLKPLFVLYLAKLLARRATDEHSEAAHFVGPILVSVLLMAGVAAQPDFGTAMLLGGVLTAMLFVARAPWGVLAMMVGGAAVAAQWLLMDNSYKQGRLLAFVDPWAYRNDSGFQLIESYLALGNGGLTGEGIGLGMQKLFYLPEAHTDFILSVIGEEWGLLGTGGVVLVVGWLLAEIYRVARRTEAQPFAHMACMGVLILLGGAYLLNLGVATGLVPTKGLALPLVSYGGSALLGTAAMLGIVARADVEVET